MTKPTAADVSAYIQVLKVFADAIRELGEVPSGVLYAQLMSVVTIQRFEQIIDALVRTNLVAKSNNVLRWVGPA